MTDRTARRCARPAPRAVVAAGAAEAGRPGSSDVVGLGLRPLPPGPTAVVPGAPPVRGRRGATLPRAAAQLMAALGRTARRRGTLPRLGVQTAPWYLRRTPSQLSRAPCCCCGRGCLVGVALSPEAAGVAVFSGGLGHTSTGQRQWHLRRTSSTGRCSGRPARGAAEINDGGTQGGASGRTCWRKARPAQCTVACAPGGCPRCWKPGRRNGAVGPRSAGWPGSAGPGWPRAAGAGLDEAPATTPAEGYGFSGERRSI